MPENKEDNQISAAEKQALLTALPCFATLTSQESLELAQLTEDVRYQSGDTIVVESALVDSIYIIVWGLAEVTAEHTTQNRVTKKIKVTKVPLSILHSGEAIGLNDTGFYSATGKRTATVTALSDIYLLKLDLKHLHQFFHTYPH